MSKRRLNRHHGRSAPTIAERPIGANIAANHARLASVDFGPYAHFGGFFMPGIC